MENEFDFVIARFVRPQDALSFEITPLSDEPLCVFTSAKNGAPLRARSLKELYGLQWVIQDSPRPTKKSIERAFAQEGLALPPQIVQTGSVYTMLNLIDKAGMVGVLPKAMVRNEGNRFRVLPVQLHGELTPYGIVTRRGMELSQPSQEMIDILVRLSRRSRSRASVRSTDERSS